MILAIDTALAATSACLLDPRQIEPLASESVPMTAGHAEALFPLLDRIVARDSNGFDGIRRVAVTVGPGSFTGIRIGVAAARAIGLACKIPVVGVSTLAALAAPSILAGSRFPIVAAIDARHGSVFVQVFGPAGATLLGPALMPISDALRAAGASQLRLVGSGGPLLAVAATPLGIGTEMDDTGFGIDIGFVARLGGLADPAHALPRPLYLKAPDAMPPSATSLLRAEA